MSDLIEMPESNVALKLEYQLTKLNENIVLLANVVQHSSNEIMQSLTENNQISQRILNCEQHRSRMKGGQIPNEN